MAGVAAAASRGADIAVLPECSVPAYVLLARSRRIAEFGARSVCAVSAAARAAGICVAFGVARAGPDGGLRNEAVFLDRRGTEVARYAKMFLWNFDARWFQPGRDLPAFDTEFGRLGMMICADGRMPEIARTLTRRGAWLLLDPTAWVSAGRSYDAMVNPQVDHVMITRARENAVWIAAADKCGSENGAVHYVGRSMIVRPDGSVAAIAAAAGPAVIVADATKPRERPVVVPVTRDERRLLRSSGRRRPNAKARQIRIGILQGRFPAGRATAMATLRAQGVDAIVDTSESPAAIRRGLGRVAGVRLAFLTGPRMSAPEPARAAALGGADVVVWIDPPAVGFARTIARTRALENKIFVVVCALAGDPNPACAIDPSGNVFAEALAGAPSGFVAFIDSGLARDKEVVPGTDAFGARAVDSFELFVGADRR